MSWSVMCIVNGLVIILLLGCQGGKGEKLILEESSICERWVMLAHEEAMFHGAVQVLHHGDVYCSISVGTANRTTHEAIHSQTLFDVASINKSIIAFLVLKAVEDGKLELDNSLSDFKQFNPVWGEFDPCVTLHHLLTHTAGIGDYDVVPDPLKQDDFQPFKTSHFTSEDYLSFIASLPVYDTCGERFHYSNFGYHLLALLLEEVYHQPFSVILARKFALPLQLKDAISPSSWDSLPSSTAMGYRWRNEKWRENTHIDFSLGRRVFCSVEDLAAWGNTLGDTSLLNKALWDQMLSNHLAPLKEKQSYGYDWVVYEKGEHFGMGDIRADIPYVIHGGSTEGYQSMLVNLNQGEWVIAVLSNTGNGKEVFNLTQSLVKQILNHEI